MFPVAFRTVTVLLSWLLLPVVVAQAPAPLAYGWQDDEPAASDNIYLAREGLSPAELVQFIERMQSKPKSIRQRPGFAEAVVDAADRLLEADPIDGPAEETALLAKFDALHFQANEGKRQADEQLLKMAQALREDTRRSVAREATFHLLRHKVKGADDLPVGQLPALLSQLQAFMATVTLEHRHRMLASATVRIINRLGDDEAAARAYRDFGRLFARSKDRELAAYGRKIGKGAKTVDPAKLASKVGRTLRLAGPTADGREFDWALYRDKVVLVYFWAAWCPPCRAQLPSLKENYTAYHDQGFDIVGVNMDTDEKVADQSIAQQQIPWVNLVGQQEANGWKHPLATKYGITALPASYLVDKQGRVVAEHLRSAELGPKLKELLGN